MAYKDYAFGLDVSHYDAVLKEDLLRGKVDFLICKLGGMDTHESIPYIDDHFNANVQAAWNLDIPAGAYYYVAPDFWLFNQFTQKGVTDLTNENHPVIKDIVRMMHAGTGWKPGVKWLVLDVEQEKAYNGVISAQWHKFTTVDIIDRLEYMMNHGQFPRMPILIYSRALFMATNAADLNVWLGVRTEVDIWPAQWVWGTGNTTTTLDYIRANYIPADTTRPVLFGNRAAWRFWQYSGERFTTPAVLNDAGAQFKLDLNLYNGTKAQLNTWSGYVPHAGQPEPPDEPPAGDYLTRAEFDAWRERLIAAIKS